MRVGVVTTSYPRFAGDAAGCFVGEQVRWLRDRGHQVQVIAAGHERADSDPLVTRVRVPAGLFYSGGAPEALIRSRRSLAAAASYSIRVAASVASARWDAVIGHWLIPSVIAATCAPRTPLSAIAHSGDVDLLCRTGLASPVVAILRARRARLVFVAEHLRTRLLSAVASGLRSYVSSADVVPMGIDVDRFRRDPVIRRERRIVFLSRLVDIKGTRVVIDCMAELARLGELIIAGDGPLRDRVARRAREVGARYLGPVGGRARDELLQSATLTLIPSIEIDGRCEGAPVTAFEAMAAGAAVVASKTGGLAELSADSVRWVRPGSARGLVDAAAALLADPVQRHLQCSAAAELASARDWRRVGPLLLPPSI